MPFQLFGANYDGNERAILCDTHTHKRAFNTHSTFEIIHLEWRELYSFVLSFLMPNVRSKENCVDFFYKNNEKKKFKSLYSFENL